MDEGLNVKFYILQNLSSDWLASDEISLTDLHWVEPDRN